MAKITFADKVTGNTLTAVELTSVKTSVNFIHDAVRGVRASNSGRIVALGNGTVGTSAPPLTAIRITPADIIEPLTISRVTLNVTTAGVGASYKVILLSSLGNGQPGNFIFDSPALDCSSLGVKSYVIPGNFVVPVGAWFGLAPAGTATATLAHMITSSHHPKIHLVDGISFPVITQPQNSYTKKYVVGGALTGDFGTIDGTETDGTPVYLTIATSCFIYLTLA